MSLVFTKQGNPDTRMIEYDQAIVRFGLEKARLQGEVAIKTKELKELHTAHDLIRSAIARDRSEMTKEKTDEIDRQTAVLLDYENKISGVKEELNLATNQKKDVENQIRSDNWKLKELEFELKKAEEEKVSLPEQLEKIRQKKVDAEKEVTSIVNFLNNYKKEKEELIVEINEWSTRKKTIDDELTSKHNELKEMNEVISILQITNKQGLDLVASFEGERKRLQEKEEFLKRKEEDLILYEQRVENRAKELGVDIKMKFK